MSWGEAGSYLGMMGADGFHSAAEPTCPQCPLLPPTPGSLHKGLAMGAVSSGQRGRPWEPELVSLSTVGMGHQHSWPVDLAPACSRAASMTCICLPHVWLRIYFIIWRKAFTANKRAN